MGMDRIDRQNRSAYDGTSLRSHKDTVPFTRGHNIVSDMAVFAKAFEIIWRVVAVHRVVNAVTARRKKKKNR